MTDLARTSHDVRLRLFAAALLGASICAIGFWTMVSNTPFDAAQQQPTTQPLDHLWPPSIGAAFPELAMVSHTGDRVALSQFRGKVVLVEPIGMTCPGCNAFSGGNDIGGYLNIVPQRGLSSIEELLGQYARVSFDRDDLVLVQLLLYDMTMQSPSADDARMWAKHFGFDRTSNVFVLAATDSRYINPESYAMIPGFYLVDRQGVLRYDSTGHFPTHNLYTELLPAVPRLLEQNKVAQPATQTPRLTMSVAEAYRAIPHARTPFDTSSAQMSANERAYLGALFRITDLGVAERVQTQMWFQSGGKSGARHDNYPILLDQLNTFEVPRSLRRVHQLVTTAMTEQQQYFAQWYRDGLGTGFQPGDPLVRQSHARLVKAYQLLLARFPGERTYNHQAFFDHLCALDFV